MEKKRYNRMVHLLSMSRKLRNEIEELLEEEFGQEDYRKLKKLILSIQWAINLSEHSREKSREAAYKKLKELREEVRQWLGR